MKNMYNLFIKRGILLVVLLTALFIWIACLEMFEKKDDSSTGSSAPGIGKAIVITTVGATGTPPDVGAFTSLDIDANNKIHIAYYDAQNQNLKYATNVSGAWKTQTVVAEWHGAGRGRGGNPPPKWGVVPRCPSGQLESPRQLQDLVILTPDDTGSLTN